MENKKIKIGIDARTLMDKNYSGISEYTFNLIKHLIKLNNKNKAYEINLFYNSAFNIKKYIPSFKDVKQIHTRYPNKIFNYILQKIFRFPKIDKLLKVDLFLMPHFNFTSIAKAKKILVVHDLSFLRFPSFFSKRKNFWHKILNVKKIMKNSNQIIAISKNTRKDIIKLAKIDKNKIKVIHSGIDKNFKVLNKNNEEMLKIKKKYGLSDDFVLCLGTLEPRKNIKSVISVFKEFSKNKNISLVIVGKNGWKNNDVLQIINQSKNKIKFLGYIPKQEKIYIYNLSSIFIYPSFYEGFGFPPLESMACGTPTITSNTSSLPEIVENGAIMINPYNKQEIITALNNLYNNQNLKNLLIKKGIKQAKKFNWEKTSIKYFQFLNEY